MPRINNSTSSFKQEISQFEVRQPHFFWTKFTINITSHCKGLFDWRCSACKSLWRLQLHLAIEKKKIYNWSMIPKLALPNKNQLGQIRFLIEIRHCIKSINYCKKCQCHHFSLTFVSFHPELISCQPFQIARYVLMLKATGGVVDPRHNLWRTLLKLCHRLPSR